VFSLLLSDEPATNVRFVKSGAGCLLYPQKRTLIAARPRSGLPRDLAVRRVVRPAISATALRSTPRSAKRVTIGPDENG
jgi:hypothetical protein